MKSLKRSTEGKIYQILPFSRRRHFLWLSLPKKIQTISLKEVLSKLKNGAVLVSSWISGLLNKMPEIMNKFAKNIRYWDHSELLRPACVKAIDFISKNKISIAINNRFLADYYTRFDVKYVIENWVRQDLFYPDNSCRKKNLVGYQPDRLLDLSVDLNQVLDVQNCTGTQFEVSSAMKSCEFFVFWNLASPHISIFKGETCGMSLYEAMACGCICLGIKHQGNRHLEKIIPLFDDINDLILFTKLLQNESQRTEETKSGALEKRFQVLDPHWERPLFYGRFCREYYRN